MLYVVIGLFPFERRLLNVGAVCSEEKTEIKLKGQETTPSSKYLDVFTAERVSDLFDSSLRILKSRKKKLKMEENKRTIDLD